MKETKRNPFEVIEPQDKAPESLKKDVMATISFSHMMMDVADLFTIKMSTTAVKMMDVDDDNHQKDDNGKK